jgi:hypothetical protein
MMIAAGCFLGIARIFRSLRRFCPWTIFLGFFGALLNGALLVGLIGAWTR